MKNKHKPLKKVFWWLGAALIAALIALPTRITIPFILEHVISIQNIIIFVLGLIIYCAVKVKEENKLADENIRLRDEFSYRSFKQDGIAETFKNNRKPSKNENATRKN